RCALYLLRHLERSQLHFLRRAIVERCHVERPNVALVALAFLFFVEACFGFVTQQTTLNHLRERFRHNKHRPLLILGKRFVEVLYDVRKDIEPNQIERSKRGALRTPHGRPSHAIDFLDRITVFQHRLDRVESSERADSIGNKVGTIFRGHDSFAESLIKKAVQETRDLGLRPFSSNDFYEVQITRWIEEVNAEEVLLEVIRSTFGKKMNRNAARI